MFAKLAVAVAALAFAAPALADCTRTYTAVAGDTCDSISAANNVSTYQLAVENPSINPGCTNLVPGTTLCLGQTGEDCSTTTVVQSGDDCDIIANAAGINMTILTMNNPQINSDCTNIYIGEVLCVAPTVEVPPAPAGSMPAASIPATATPAIPSTAVPSSVVASASAAVTSSAVASSTDVASSTLTADAATQTDDDDDSNLPWCDEL